MIRYLLSRMGCLMVIGGAITLALGVAAARSDYPAFKLVLIGAGLAIFGFLLWNKLRVRERRNTRFSKFRRHEERDQPRDRSRWDE